MQLILKFAHLSTATFAIGLLSLSLGEASQARNVAHSESPVDLPTMLEMASKRELKRPLIQQKRLLKMLRKELRTGQTQQREPLKMLKMQLNQPLMMLAMKSMRLPKIQAHSLKISSSAIASTCNTATKLTSVYQKS